MAQQTGVDRNVLHRARNPIHQENGKAARQNTGLTFATLISVNLKRWLNDLSSIEGLIVKQSTVLKRT